MADLKHRDWLLFTTKRMIQSVDEDISVDIVDTPNGGKLLIASGITEAAINKIIFLTNTDQNNNYLYLEDFKVYLYGSYTPLNIPGLKETVVNLFRASDTDSFLNGEKTQDTFNVMNFSSSSFTGTNFSQFVDQLTALLPFTPTTTDYVKTYEITLNPDINMKSYMNASNSPAEKKF